MKITIRVWLPKIMLTSYYHSMHNVMHSFIVSDPSIDLYHLKLQYFGFDIPGKRVINGYERPKGSPFKIDGREKLKRSRVILRLECKPFLGNKMKLSFWAHLIQFKLLWVIGYDLFNSKTPENVCNLFYCWKTSKSCVVVAFPKCRFWLAPHPREESTIISVWYSSMFGTVHV